ALLGLSRAGAEPREREGRAHELQELPPPGAGLADASGLTRELLLEEFEELLAAGELVEAAPQLATTLRGEPAADRADVQWWRGSDGFHGSPSGDRRRSRRAGGCRRPSPARGRACAGRPEASTPCRTRARAAAPGSRDGDGSRGTTPSAGTRPDRAGSSCRRGRGTRRSRRPCARARCG